MSDPVARPDPPPAASPAGIGPASVPAVLRLAMAALIVAAVVVTFVMADEQWTAAGYPDRGVLVANFFSFFTIESNIGAAVVLAAGAVLLLVRRRAEPGWFSTVRGAVTVYMVITGIVYNALLRGIPVTGAAEGAAWPNEVLHVVGPIFLLVDWILAPGRTRLSWTRLPVLLGFPLVWVAYTLVRGPLVIDQVRRRDSWYPYPFLDPAQVGGYGGVTLYVIGIAIGFGLVSAGVILVSRVRMPRMGSRAAG